MWDQLWERAMRSDQGEREDKWPYPAGMRGLGGPAQRVPGEGEEGTIQTLPRGRKYGGMPQGTGETHLSSAQDPLEPWELIPSQKQDHPLSRWKIPPPPVLLLLQHLPGSPDGSTGLSSPNLTIWEAGMAIPQKSHSILLISGMFCSAPGRASAGTCCHLPGSLRGQGLPKSPISPQNYGIRSLLPLQACGAALAEPLERTQKWVERREIRATRARLEPSSPGGIIKA